MKKKLTVIKVGGKVVEEESSLNALLNDFTKLEGSKVNILAISEADFSVLSSKSFTNVIIL